MVVTNKSAVVRPALEGGRPVRSEPLPFEWCGTHHMDDREVEAVSRVMRSRSLFRYYGPDLQREAETLEKEFAAYIGRRYALGVSSGTAALQICLGALGVGPGDEVILPGYFWVATVAAVVRAGAIPVLADVDDTWGIDPKKVEALMTSRTKAILPVHMGGVIGRIDEIVSLARQRGIAVLEDCAQASGASQNGRKAGAFGDMGIFSFQLNKHMTSGEGGLLVTDDERLYRRAFAVHDLGYFRNEKGRLVRDDPEAQLWGIGARMGELNAAVARVQFSKLDNICERMRTAKYRVRAALEGIPGISLRRVLDPAGDAGSFLYLTFAKREASLRFVEAVRAEGIRAPEGGMYPIHMDDWGLHIYYNVPSLVNKRGLGRIGVWDLAENRASRASYGKGTCPVLDDLVSRSVLMCIASNLTEKDVEDVIEGFRRAAAYAGR